MRIGSLYFRHFEKSLNNNSKIIRTISKPKPYIQKQQKQEIEFEQKIQDFYKKQKEIENKALEESDKLIDNHRAGEIQYYALLLFGVKIEKEKISETIKARKAK